VREILEVSDAQEWALAQAMAAEFFAVVPAKYETFCPVVSRIAVEVFRHFGIPANLVPCQLWHASDEGYRIVGFTGKVKPDKWDGHVICMTQTLLVDGAVRGLHRDFGVTVPAVAVAAKLTTPSQIIARGGNDRDGRLWWINAPYGFDTTPPLQPVDIIGQYARGIAERVKRRLGDPPLSGQQAA
jgi:hypothetical protein